MSRIEILMVALAFGAWVPGLQILAEAWRANEFSTHGFLVPWVALWAATAHRSAMAALPIAPMPGARALLALCALGYLMSLGLRQATLLGLIFVATVVALLLVLRGRAWVSLLRFPLGYLAFMVPLPIAWVTPLIVELQLIVSTVAVRILQALGVAIYREGNVLVLPGDVSLFVAEACSGITSLITLIPIGVFIAYFTEATLRRRAVLVAAVVPIALLGNLTRVVATVLLALRVDVDHATRGPLHEWAGVATYVVGCLCLLGLGALMRRVWPEGDSEPALAPIAAPKP
ncbi:MAG: exosortase/archaeosortase family protein [Deltaproteobacteria bacterium]|nr:exosortase/archaeosortase family protein [Deltaproteobacteria bacterium]